MNFTNDNANLPTTEWAFNGTTDYLAFDPTAPQRLYVVGGSGIFVSVRLWRVRDLAVAPIAKDARARALTKRACPDGDSESFPLKRRRRAHLNKSTDDGAQA